MHTYLFVKYGSYTGEETHQEQGGHIRYGCPAIFNKYIMS